MATALRVSLCVFCDEHLWGQVSKTLLYRSFSFTTFQMQCYDIITDLICEIDKRQYLYNEKRYFKTKNAILLYFILKGVSNKRKLFLCHIHLNQSFLQHALFCHICNRSLYIISFKYVSVLSYRHFCLPFVQVKMSAVSFYILIRNE